MTDDSQLDLSPLIDVIFILLIFFIVSTTFVKDRALDVDRPKSSQSEAADEEGFRVGIDITGQVTVNGRPVHSTALQSLTREHFRRSASKAAMVIADRNLAVEKLVQTLDDLRAAGAKDLALITDQEGK